LPFEGEPGVGQTEAGKAPSSTLDTPLLRRQCHEGLTAPDGTIT
jgi:MoxR-like ATPase